MSLEILELEQELLFKTESKRLDERIDAQLNRVQEVIGLLEEQVVMASMKDKHKTLRTLRAQSLSPTQLEAFQEIVDHPILRGAQELTSLRAQRDRHHVLGSHALLQRDYPRALDHFQAQVQLWEAHPDHIRQQPRGYVRALTELLSASIVYKRYGIAETVIERLAGVQPQSAEDEINLINQSCYIQLLYYLNTGKFEAGAVLVDQIRDLLARYAAKVPASRQITFYYNLTIFHFLQGNYSDALHWLNQIRNLPRIDVRQHIQDFSRVFQIVIHFELGNHDLVEYLHWSALRHYQGKKKMQSFERVVFSHLKDILFPSSAEKGSEAIQALYLALWKLAEKREVREPAGMYELIFWLESKIKQQPISTTYRQRVQERIDNVAKALDPDKTFKSGGEILGNQGS